MAPTTFKPYPDTIYAGVLQLVMPIISVRISGEEKEQMLRNGGVTRVVREAIKLYLQEYRRREVLKKPGELQSHKPVKATTLEDLQMIKKDRSR